MTNTNRLEAAIARVDELTADLGDARIEAMMASATARTAKKAEIVEATQAAGIAKARVAALSTALKKAEAEVKAAEKAEKADAKQAAIEAAADRAGAVDADNPFSAAEVNWTALGKWCANRFRDSACYVEGMGWGEWSGCCWKFSGKPSATLLDRVRGAWAGIDCQVTEKLNANPKAGEHVLSHAEGSMTVHRSRFNSDAVAHLLAFQNVTVDLRTGKTMPHNPTHYMTGALQCHYNPDADAARVEQVFARFWPADPETARCFQLAFGYSLTGEKTAKRVPMLIGNQEDSNKNGDNGKSMFQNAALQMFGAERGGWGTTVKAALVADTGDRDANSHDGAKVPLLWKRFAMASEIRKGASIDSGEFNRLSGYDSQLIRPPYGSESVQAVIVATTYFSMNTSFRFKTWDKATKSRILAFPFNETFHDAHDCPPGGQLKELGLDRWLSSKEGQEALALYAVRGAMAFYAQNNGKPGNLPTSPAMDALRDKILRLSNPFAELFEDYFDFDPEWDTAQSTIHKIVNDIHGQMKPWEKELMVSALGGFGVVSKTIKGERFYRGVKLTAKGMKQASLSGNQNPCFRRGAVVSIAAE